MRIETVPVLIDKPTLSSVSHQHLSLPSRLVSTSPSRPRTYLSLLDYFGIPHLYLPTASQHIRPRTRQSRYTSRWIRWQWGYQWRGYSRWFRLSHFLSSNISDPYIGIIFGAIAALILIGIIIYCARRSTPLRGPIFPSSSTKSYPITQEQVYLPQYTAPTQPIYVQRSIPQPPPAVYPVQPHSTYYAHTNPQGVRFGEVGVRRI